MQEAAEQPQAGLPVPSLVALCVTAASEEQLRQLADDRPGEFGAMRNALLDKRMDSAQALEAYQKQHARRLQAAFGLDTKYDMFNTALVHKCSRGLMSLLTAAERLCEPPSYRERLAERPAQKRQRVSNSAALDAALQEWHQLATEVVPAAAAAMWERLQLQRMKERLGWLRTFKTAHDVEDEQQAQLALLRQGEARLQELVTGIPLEQLISTLLASPAFGLAPRFEGWALGSYMGSIKPVGLRVALWRQLCGLLQAAAGDMPVLLQPAASDMPVLSKMTTTKWRIFEQYVSVASLVRALLEWSEEQHGVAGRLQSIVELTKVVKLAATGGPRTIPPSMVAVFRQLGVEGGTTAQRSAAAWLSW